MSITPGIKKVLITKSSRFQQAEAIYQKRHLHMKNSIDREKFNKYNLCGIYDEEIFTDNKFFYIDFNFTSGKRC